MEMQKHISDEREGEKVEKERVKYSFENINYGFETDTYFCFTGNQDK